MLHKLFAAGLRQYYTHNGNRIIFDNGMSLNKLAVEMWERLGEAEVDPSVISRVIQGKRLFSFRQLRAFCDILGILQLERNELFEYLEKDMLNREGELLTEARHYILTSFMDKQKVLNYLARVYPEVDIKRLQNLYNQLIPKERSLSKIGVTYEKKAYYLLIKEGLKLQGEAGIAMSDFDVSIPVCGFDKTVANFENNCNCGYHLALFGVIKRSMEKTKSRAKTQKAIESWIRYFFPSNVLSDYVGNGKN